MRTDFLQAGKRPKILHELRVSPCWTCGSDSCRPLLNFLSSNTRLIHLPAQSLAPCHKVSALVQNTTRVQGPKNQRRQTELFLWSGHLKCQKVARPESSGVSSCFCYLSKIGPCIICGRGAISVAAAEDLMSWYLHLTVQPQRSAEIWEAVRAIFIHTIIHHRPVSHYQAGSVSVFHHDDGYQPKSNGSGPDSDLNETQSKAVRSLLSTFEGRIWCLC